MNDLIAAFVASKSLSLNSQKSYYYDLQQFSQTVGSRINKERLALYEQSLSGLKVSAKKRKISAVNQFLYFLYTNQKLEHFYRLQVKDKLPPRTAVPALLDFACFYQRSQNACGQLIALLIIETGLSPAEIQRLTVKNIDTALKVLRVDKAGFVRIIEFSDKLLPFLVAFSTGDKTYLFEHQGSVYSRQWFFNQLKAYLSEIGQSELTAQALREQFILAQKAKGKTPAQLSRSMGLKSPLTLEKYYKD
ncbi:site-specific tyrosine recombinase XerD [Streptococcus chenjunshii]|uniref:Tyrosine recombinase XerD-like n=1 Tax=Streptococcus chenjunshii TaxID=2173853 RepID=A0A372KLT9_9STRE|nr:site-specific tyrosine recombinase XerD [Streptococcus chenjunshii]AXQ78120.1 site-specific tyrosine recombinase XerD [Streptococcus chenjunshii]RFU51215.1 site-specific tyrosine recombinase XerD [Streptococcus chenjunshii]RFU53245.1 site-specific tyrosine recombinase XerD [Streptococcus chenjunshii]